jgi:transketolase
VVLSVSQIRCLSADQVQAANSGHPGAPMGCAPMAHTLWSKFMNYSPAEPEWFDRDRFVLSNGHACALQYSMLHLSGYDLSLDDLKLFRKCDSKTPGHPENFCTAGVEVSTGPLGQGLSNAVGMAIAEANLAATFNKDGHDIVNHYTYVICGDGCLQEGITSEACSLAGHLGLGKLIVLYDDNKIQIDGSTELAFTEDVKMRYESYNWQVIELADGTDVDAMAKCIEEAKACTDKPSMIKIRTVIGEGCPSKAGSHKIHGAPLGPDALKEMKTHLGLDPEESFQVPGEVADFYAGLKAAGVAKGEAWNQKLAAYVAAFPAEGAELQRRIAGELPADWESKMPTYAAGDADMATRQWSELSLNALAESVPELMGGSADLTPSNLTALKCSGDFQKGTPAGRYIRFGVREHGMAAICNGIAAHGGLVPYCATFLNFIGYALGAVRVAALSRFRILYIMTHDSIGLGEDGPTHQPVEMLESLRAMPNMFVFRPCDGNEVTGSYIEAMKLTNSPSVFALSRQGMPIQEGTSAASVAKGAYTMVGCDGTPDLIIAATGSEMQYAVQAKAAMGDKKVALVSMPCWELFEAQPLEYQLSVFPEGVPVLSVEASGTKGWERFSHLAVGMDRYGASGPIKAVYPKFGFTVENIVEQAKVLLSFYDGKPAPSKVNVPKSTFVVSGH